MNQLEDAMTKSSSALDLTEIQIGSVRSVVGNYPPAKRVRIPKVKKPHIPVCTQNFRCMCIIISDNCGLVESIFEDVEELPSLAVCQGTNMGSSATDKLASYTQSSKNNKNRQKKHKRKRSEVERTFELIGT